VNSVRTLDGLRTVVTGASRGIGLAIAKKLASEGSSLFLVSRDEEALSSVARELAAAHDVDCHYQALDIAQSNEHPEMMSAAAEKLGGIDALVNNAGANFPMKVFSELTRDEYRHMLQLNLTAQMDMTAAALPYVARSSNGSILFVASMAAKIGVPGWSAYCAAKHGVLGFMKALAKECAVDGVRVNAICPGFVQTDLTSKENFGIWAESLGVSEKKIVREMVLRQTPQQKFVDQDSIAVAVRYFLSNDAADVTGQSLNVSCGIGDY